MDDVNSFGVQGRNMAKLLLIPNMERARHGQTRQHVNWGVVVMVCFLVLLVCSDFAAYPMLSSPSVQEYCIGEHHPGSRLPVPCPDLRLAKADRHRRTWSRPQGHGPVRSGIYLDPQIGIEKIEREWIPIDPLFECIRWSVPSGHL